MMHAANSKPHSSAAREWRETNRAARTPPALPAAGTPQLLRASVLIVVLWASVGLVSVALLFGHSMLMVYRGSDNDLAGRQADQAIEGAARYAESLLANAETPGAMPDVTAYENEEVSVGEATFWFLGRATDTSDGKTREFGLVDESGKLDINAATTTKDMLMNLPGMTDDFATAIIEWRKDPNTNTTAAGTAATSTASSISKQGPFESIEELALVTGATRDILHGEDANLNGVVDANEDDGNKSLPDDNSDGKLDPGILEYVTVFGRESNKQSGGSTDRINITDVARVTTSLTTLLDEKLGAGRAGKILPLVANGGALRSVLEFYIRAKGNDFFEDDFGKIAYELTTSDPAAVPYLTGMVNVNTASAAVLGCIPGIGADKAATLVSTRLSRTPGDTNYAWVVAVLGDPDARTAGPFLTGRSSQITADVAAVGRYGRGYRRTKFVIDSSSGTPRIIYRRNLAPLGWALGSDIRADLALRKETR